LKGGPEQQYKKRMHVMGKLDGEGLPRPLAAEELEIMLGNSQAKRFMGSLEFNS
jgi:hypothetical protein